MDEKKWRIFESIKIGSKICKNRIVMASHSYGYVDKNGTPKQELVDYLTERAKGGVGLIIMGGTSVSREGTLLESISQNFDDKIIPAYQKIASSVHKYDCLILDQLMHIGGQQDSYEGAVIVAPSAIPHENCSGLPVELSIPNIKKIIQEFASASQRAKIGGIDGIEIKCDQGFLLHQFLSPYYNRRDDEYGGNQNKRNRFLIELLSAIREKVGADFIVGVRISGDTLTPGDLTLQDTISISKELCDTNLIDYLHINGGTNSTWTGYWVSHGDSSISNLNFVQHARSIKQHINIPVIASSMISHPLEAEMVVSSGYSDLVAMTRPHIADPEIVNKTLAGNIDDIRPCVYCNQGCVGNHWRGTDVRCIHNPATGREQELGIGTLRKTTKKKRIWVIGGGVAGLEFARIASERGHYIDLFERQTQLGGQIVMASSLPYCQGLMDIVRYLNHQAAKQKVKIHLGVNVDAKDILGAAGDYDELVIATGAKMYIPPVYNNIDLSKCLTIDKLFEQENKLGSNIVLVDQDWRQNPLAIAEWLLQRGKKVKIISRGFVVGEGINVVSLTSSYSRLMGQVELVPLTSLVSFVESTVTVRNVVNNSTREFELIDQVVFATGALPENNLFNDLIGKVKNIYKIGDSEYPRGIPEAMLAANRLARVI